MGAIKPALVLHYLQQYSLSSVSLSDTDTVWLRDPKGAISMPHAIPPVATAGATKLTHERGNTAPKRPLHLPASIVSNTVFMQTPAAGLQ